MRADVAIGVILLVLSSAMFTLTFTFPEQTVALSPTFFPRLVTLCMAALACLLVVKALRQPPRPMKPAPTFSAATWMRQGHVRRIALMVAIGFIYTQVLDSLGFLIATGLFLAATVLLFMERRWTVVLAVAVLGSSVLYGVFRMIFKVPLPRFDLF
jgi:hypothetical protein